MDKNTENITIDELYKIATQAETDTFLSAIGKPYNENLISDYLAFILDKNRNGGLGVAPLNALLQCVKSGYKVDDKDDIIIEREHCLNGNQKNRIDILIHNITKSLYIGIENKILSDEGDKQTTRYADYLFGKSVYTRNGEKNIGIFLTQSGIEAKNSSFENVTYKQILDAFPKDTEKNAFYNDFMKHIEKFIVRNALSENDLNFISALNESTKKILLPKERKKDRKLQAIYEKSIALRNIFFDGVEDTISQYMDKNKFKFKIKRSGFYIQFYETDWEDEGIHFEIIIPYNKGLLFPDAKIFIMLHREKGDRIGLRNKFNICKKDIENLGFNKPGNVILGEVYTISDILLNNGDIKERIFNMIKTFDIASKTDKINKYLSFKNN